MKLKSARLGSRLALAAVVNACVLSTADAAGVMVSIAPAPSGLPGDLTMSWTGAANNTYLIQTATNISGSNAWSTFDAVTLSNSTGYYQISPGASAQTEPVRFYRLVLPQPELESADPAFINSADSTALLYLLGQSLPSNATVVIDGQDFTPTLINSNGIWASVSLSGLAASTSITGQVLVIDNATSNVVATLAVQNPMFYGTAMPAEQLQGPPDEPPASPSCTLIRRRKRNRDNEKSEQVETDRGHGGGGSGHVEPGIAVSDEAQTTDTGPHHPIRHKPTAIIEPQGGGRTQGIGGAGIAVKKQGVSHWSGGSRRGRTIAPGTSGSGCGTTPHLRLATGEFQETSTDLVVPGRGMDFVWLRTYRSRTGPMTAQGAGWDFSYNVSLTSQANGTLLLTTGDGRTSTFYPNGAGGWSRDEYFVSVGDLNGDGAPDLLFSDGGKWLFNPLGSVAAGKLASIVDRNGNTISLNYDGSGRLVSVVDTLNRTNRIAYNSNSLLESVTDFSGRTVRYNYDAGSNLVACISPPVTGTPTGNDFPGGKTNHYTYSSGFSDERLNHNLTGCSDGLGQNWLQIVYQTNTDPASLDFDAVDYIQEGQYLQHLRRYAQAPSPTNGRAVIKSIYCDAVGNVSECYFDSRQRCLRELDYTGRSNPNLPVTETVNRPSGKLRAGDPDFYETLWTWNPDSLCRTVAANPGTLPRECIFLHERDLNSQATARKKGDLRVIRQLPGAPVDTNGDGTPDTTERSWHFAYDPRFGSPGAPMTLIGPVTKSRKDMLNWYSKVLLGPVTKSRKATLDWLSVVLTGPVTKSRKDMLAWCSLTPSGPVPGSRGTVTTAPKLMRRWNYGLADTASGAHTGDMCGNHKDCMMAVAAQDTDGNGGLDRLTVAYGDVNPDGLPDFCIAATDPDGNQTTASYDAQGDGLHAAAPLGAQADFTYNAFGQLTAITNSPDGTGYRAVDLFNYYTSGASNGYLQSFSQDAGGLALTTAFEYDARGNATRIVDPRGNDWLYAYNALDQLVQSQTPTNINARCTSSFIYDANDNLVQAATEVRDNSDVLQHTVARNYAYDFLDRCVSVADQVAQDHSVTNGLAYDGNANLTAIFSPLAMSGADANNFMLYQYDERDFLWRQVEGPLAAASARTNQWDYDPNGNAIQFTASGLNGPPEATVLAYDGFDRCVSGTDAMGNVETLAFDRCDNALVDRVYGETNDVPGSAGNRLLAQFSYQYDSLYRVTAVQQSRFDAAGHNLGSGHATTSYSRAPNGQLLSVTDDNQHTTRYLYDTAGRCSQVTDAKSNLVQFAYDRAGNLTNELATDTPDINIPLEQFSVRYSYDALNRCVSQSDNVGNTRTYGYDSLNRLLRLADPNGHLSGAMYDDAGRCTVAIADMDEDGVLDFALDAKVAYSWDDNSRCIASADANTNITYYSYDSLNRCIGITNANRTTSLFSYDSFGNLLTRVDPNGTTVSNTYDHMNRIIHRDLAARNGVVASTTFESFAYDGLSRLVLASNDISGSTFAYDSLGNCLASSQDGFATAFSYDGVGNLLSLTYPSGRTVTYAYDALNEPTNVSSSAPGAALTGLAAYAYEGPGRPGRILRNNGVNTRITWDGLMATSNPTGDFGWREVASIRHIALGGSITVDQRQFAYDHSQNKTSRTQTAPFYTGGPLHTNAFLYDAVDRLTGFSSASGSSADYSLTYTLDGNGNRLAVSSNGVVSSYSMNPGIPPGDSEMNRYSSTPYGLQSYDSNGNLATRSSTHRSLGYRYDYADRVVEVDDLTSGTPVTLASFGYDALGRRVSKTIYQGAPPVPVPNEYVFGGSSILEQYQSGSLNRSYAYASLPARPNTAAQAAMDDLDEDGIPDLVASFAADGTLTYYHADELGSVLALTDAKGNVLERCDYSDYGAPLFLDSLGQPLSVSASPHGNPFLFRSFVWDSEADLYLRKAGGDHPAYLTCRKAGREQREQLALNTFGSVPSNPNSLLGPLKWMAPESLTQSSSYLDPFSGRLIDAGGGTSPAAEYEGDPDRPLAFFSGDNNYSYHNSNPWGPGKPKKSKPTGGIVVVKSVDLASP